MPEECYLVVTQVETIVCTSTDVLNYLTQWSTETDGPISVFVQRWEYNSSGDTWILP